MLKRIGGCVKFSSYEQTRHTMGASNSITRPDSPVPTSPNNSTSINPMSDSASKTQSKEPQSEKKPSLEDPPSEVTEPDGVQADIGEEKEDEEEEEEEKGECGFCVFMKGGGCKDSFVAWENCIEEAEKTNEDIAQKCFDLTSALKDCMLAHPDYYEPILRAEKAAEEKAIKELDEEKQKDKEKEEIIEVENEKPESSEAALGKGSEVQESAGGKQ